MSSPPPAPSSAAQALLAALGAASLATQTMLIRELLVVVHGTELVIGMALAAWLAWIGIGALLGTAFAGRLTAPRANLQLWAVAGAAASVLELEAVRHGPALMGVGAGLVMSWRQAAVLAAVTAAPFCLVVGFTFPVACRLARAGGPAVGRLYAAESAGALAGGLVFSFALAGRLGHLTVAAASTALVIAAAATLGGRRMRPILALLALAVTALLPMVSRWDDSSRRRALERLIPGQQLVAALDTKYGRYALAQLEGQLTLHADGLPAATLPDPYEASAVVHGLLAQAPDARRILVLGNPFGGLASELLAALASQPGLPPQIAFLHPDRELIEELGRLLPDGTLPRDPRIRVLLGDPRQFLAVATDQRWDVVFVDGGEPTSVQQNRLFTVEMFAAARGALARGGVVALRLPSSSAYVGRELSELAVSVRNALVTVFPDVVVTPGEHSWFFGSPAPGRLTRQAQVVRARLDIFPGAGPQRAALLDAYRPEHLARFEQMLAAGGRAAITNSDARPSSSYYGGVLWDRLSSDDPTRVSLLSRALTAAQRLGAIHALAAATLLLALGLALGRRRSTAASALSVLVAGFAAMAQNVLLLLAYQSSCGALFQRLAVVSGLFMLGTAVGAAAAVRWPASVPRRRAALLLAGNALFSTLLSHGALFPSLSPPAREVVYGGFFAIAGAWLGATLTATAEAISREDDAGRAGGLVNAMDHLGATLGALLTGTLFLPVIGASAMLQLVALLLLATALFRWRPA